MKEKEANTPTPKLIKLFQKISFLLREKIKKGKGGADLIKELPDGSLVSPYDTLADCFKNLEEIFTESGKKADLRIWLDLDANDFYNPETEKYDFENAKKPSSPEELEDALFKVFSDKKIVGVV